MAADYATSITTEDLKDSALQVQIRDGRDGTMQAAKICAAEHYAASVTIENAMAYDLKVSMKCGSDGVMRTAGRPRARSTRRRLRVGRITPCR